MSRSSVLEAPNAQAREYRELLGNLSNTLVDFVEKNTPAAIKHNGVMTDREHRDGASLSGFHEFPTAVDPEETTFQWCTSARVMTIAMRGGQPVHVTLVKKRPEEGIVHALWLAHAHYRFQFPAVKTALTSDIYQESHSEEKGVHIRHKIRYQGSSEDPAVVTPVAELILKLLKEQLQGA